MSWQESGRCRSVDPELFHNPDEERGADRKARNDQAKAICARCVVLVECRRYALETRERYGVWGGLDEAQREDIWTAQRRRVRVRTDAQRERDRVAKAQSRRSARTAS